MTLTSRLRRGAPLLLSALALAFSGLLLGGSQTPANAGLLDDLLSGPGSITGPVVGGIAGKACDEAPELPILGQGFCVLRSAGIKYRTTYRRSDGTELVRTVNAMVALPSLINADDDLLPEGTALLAIKSTNTFTLRFDRLLTETAAVPVRFEVIVPLPGADPEKDNVFIGFDARQGRMPTRWDGRIVLIENTETRTNIGVEISRTGAAPRLQVVGGLFDGTVANRVDPIAVSIDPQPVPATLAANLLIVDDPQTGDELDIAANASSLTSVTATLENVDGPKRQDVTAFIKDLPTTPTRVRVVSPTETEQHVYYSALQQMPNVRFSSELRKAGVLTDRLQVQLDDLPLKLEFHQPSPGVGWLSTTGGPIGRTKVTINDGTFTPFPANPGTHLTYLYDGVLGTPVPPGTQIPNALDLEVEHLEAASFDTTQDFIVDMTTQPAPGVLRQTLRGIVRDQATLVDATVHEIPTHVKVIATESGEVHYNGFGQTVPRIDANIKALTGTLSPTSRYTQVDATILQLPPTVDVAIAPTSDHVVADAGDGVGSLRVHARDASTTCVADLADDRGAVVVDTTAHACLAARFDGLKHADVQVEPLRIDVQANQAQDLALRATVDEANDGVVATGHLVGTITQAPADFKLEELPEDTVGPDTTKRYVVRAGEVTPHLKLTGSDLPASYGNGFLDFDITGLPKTVDVVLPDEGDFQTFVLDAPDGIGKAELELAKRNTPCLNTVTAEAGVGIIDTAFGSCIGVRIAGVKHAEFQLDPLHIKTETSTALEFQIHALIDDVTDSVSGPGTIDARIHKLPRQLEITGSTGTVPLSPGSSTLDIGVRIDSGQGISELDYEGTNLPAAFPARYMDLHVEGIADRTTIRVPKDGEVQTFGLSTVVAPIRLVSVQLSDDGVAVPLELGKDNVVIDNGSIGLRLHDLQRARFANRLGEGPRYDGTLDVYAKHSEDPYSYPLHVKIDDGTSHLGVDLPEVPAELSFSREGTYSPTALYSPDRPAMMRLSASDPIPQLLFSMEDEGVSTIDVDVSDIPDQLDICLWSGGGTNHQVKYSNPTLSDPTWCYHPEKKPWAQGGDPFALFDTVQFTLSRNSALPELISLNKLDLWSKDNSGTSRTTITEAKFGLIRFAFGQGFIWGDYTDPAMRAMYRGDDDGDFDGVFDPELGDRRGLHLFADTDDHGFSARLRYESVDAVTDETEVTVLKSLKKLVAHDKFTVLDMTGIPGEVRQRGTLGVCTVDPDLFELSRPGFPPIIAAYTLADFLNCDV